MISLAVANYHEVYQCFPPPFVADENGRPMHSWRVLILPFMEQHQLYADYDFSEPWDSPQNLELLTRRPETFLLYGGHKEGTDTNYLAVVGPDTMWPTDRILTSDAVTDGTSNTIHFVENVGSGIQWTEPRDLNLDTMSMSIDDDPVNGISSWMQPPAASLVDGAAFQLEPTMTESELRGLLTINDGRGVPAKNRIMTDGRNRPLKSNAAKPADSN